MNPTILAVVLLIALVAWFIERGKRRLLQEVVQTRPDPPQTQSASGDGFWVAIFVIGALAIIFIR